MRSSLGTAIRIKNRILAALPYEEQQRLLPKLEQVSLKTGQILYEPHGRIGYAYFPETAVVSILSMVEEGATVEVSLVGNEGIIGIPIFLKSNSIPYRALVQRSGSSLRMEAHLLRAESDQCGPFHDLMHHYLHTLIVELSQSGACNRFHTVEQRLCRLLLATLDRMISEDLEFTHEMLAEMLGVNRSTASLTAGALQKRGLIEYTRGRLKILDRHGLEAAVCECYWVNLNEFRRLFGT
jgi:CRP-like cAMP-binding protein